MRVFVTGGTGFIGDHLVGALVARGDEVRVLTRNPGRAKLSPRVTLVEGDPTLAGDWQREVDGCDALVHLAGESVAGRRWNAQFKQLLVSSRLDSTQRVVQAIAEASSKPGVLISASGIDYYPFAEDLDDQPDFFEDSWIEEGTPRGDSFLAKLCRDWELEATAAEAHGARVVLVRTGLVCAKDGGALAKLRSVFRAFIGGRLGSGSQWMSWIHIADAVRAYLHAIDSAAVSGPINLVAPEPVRNREFARALGAALGRPAVIPTPAFAIRLAIGEFAEYVLGGRRARSRVLRETGFEFEFEDVKAALADLFS